MIPSFLADRRNAKKGVDKWKRKRYHANQPRRVRRQVQRKEKISDEEAERRDDDVHGDVHVQHVHVSSRSNWSTDFPGQYDVLLKQDETPSQTAEGRLTCRCFFVAYLCMNEEVVI